MLLSEKVAVIFGAGGCIGSEVARTFAREGAKLYLSGRSAGPVEAVAREIAASGGSVRATEVDVLDERAVERELAGVRAQAGRVDVVFNAMGFKAVQGVALTELSREDFVHPIVTWTTAQFLTARAAARHMTSQRSGVILLLSASPARVALGLTSGFGVACAAVEGLSRTLAAELGPQGVRVLCIRPHRIGETLGSDADFPAGSAAEFRSALESWTLLKRLPTLAEVASSAAFLASDHAAAMTGTVANLTCGMSVD
jgi:3-oxoacyl-[acyl-carrier protein] reductase